MANIIIGTPFNIDLEFNTASIAKRIASVILDMLILMLYMLVVYKFVIVNFNMGAKMNEFISMMSISILPFIYFPISEILLNGQTPGKRMLGVKVMDAEGKEPSISQYLLRWLLGFGNYSVFLLPYIIGLTAAGMFPILLYCLCILGVFYFPDFLCSAISSKSQRIADFAAGTVVIDVKKKMNFAETIYEEINTLQNIEAKFPEVMRLSDKDINGIHQLLNKKASKKDDWEYQAMIVQKICKALNITTQGLDDTTFLQQLLFDYNLLTQKK